jgi:hypothetical protein
MPIPVEALAFEDRFRGRKGEPTLAEAYRIMRDHWRKGDRDRELGLHLMFAAWLCLCEPLGLTGMGNVLAYTNANGHLAVDLQNTFNDVHDHFSPSIQDDAEMLYVVGLMASYFPYVLGDEHEWEMISEKYRRRYRELLPNGIDPNTFRNRSAFGDYFEHQAKENHRY